MRVRTDDELYRVDRTFLGPRGKPLLVQVSYLQWGLFLVLLVAVLIGWRMLDIPLNPAGFLIAGALAWGGAHWLVRHLTYDRPLIGELVRVWQELAAPRPDLHEHDRVEMLHVDVPRWRAGARPDPRWWVRLGHWFGNLWGRVLRGFRRTGQVYENGEWRDVR